MIQTAIADNTKRIIAERGLKNRAVAERAGFSVQQFSALINKRKIMKDTDVMAIANALGVTPNDLFGIQSSQKSSDIHSGPADTA